MGAPSYNLNAMRNGKRLVRLTVGELPTKLHSVKVEARKYRRGLEDAVLDVRGEVSVMDAHRIDTAAGATMHVGVCRWLLRQKLSSMETGDILACSREMLRAKESRDRAVKALGLDKKMDGVLDALYTEPQNTAAESPRVASKGSKVEEG